GEFAIIEGRVRAVHETNRAVFLNFGDDWKTDFSVILTPQLAAILEREAQSYGGFENLKVQVRGYLDIYYGPSLKVEHEGQVEFFSQ
ncbi:MAG: hypothetical protein AAGE89_18125, partial [Pseudomonadota bacterium]